MTDFELSPSAQAHRDAMLPGLLGAVRRRRQRRAIRRAVAALLLVGAVVTLPFVDWQRGAERSGDGAHGGGTATDVASANEPAFRIERVPSSATGSWSTVRNDPETVARYAVTTVRRADWFVDDRGLNQLLHGADRRAGVVRTATGVFVNPQAVDPWPRSGE